MVAIPEDAPACDRESVAEPAGGSMTVPLIVDGEDKDMAKLMAESK